MLIQASDRAASANRATPKPGQQMMSEVQDDKGNVLYQALFDLIEVPSPAGTRGLALKTRLVKEMWPDAAFKAAMTAPPPRASGDAEAAVKALQLGWDIIKDGRAVTDLKGASTAILNPRNMNPFDYYEAKPAQSPHYYWWGYNAPFKDWKAFEIWVRLCGMYGAKAPDDIPPGQYLPSVYVDFPKTPWCEWGLRMDGNAQVMSPGNIGPKGNAIAYCEVVATITVSSIIDPSRPQPFKFSAAGNTGFRQKRG